LSNCVNVIAFDSFALLGDILTNSTLYVPVPKAPVTALRSGARLRRSPMFIVISEKQCELRRSGIKVNQMPLLWSITFLLL
jgi:hypothetical protein